MHPPNKLLIAEQIVNHAVCEKDDGLYLFKGNADNSTEKLTDDQTALVNTEFSRLQTEYDITEYQRKRANEYPLLTDLADAMYWASQGDNTKLDAYYAKCEAVKLKYPKA